jgi:hypothetical protein
MKFRTLAIGVLLAAFAGCSKKKEEPAPAPPPVPAAVADAAVGSAADTGSGTGSAQAADVEVPTEVDFEEQATTEITDKNVEAQVKAIEKDLAPQ